MPNENNGKTDPVCKMTVDIDSLHVEYLGSHFYFCSEQCKERFNKNPHLYVGKTGTPSPKQQGMHIIKRRSIRLDTPVTTDIRQQLIEVLMGMMGIKQVNIEGDLIQIHYDLLEATAEQIEKAIERSGAQLEKVWKERLKRAFVHYIEETELENLEHQNESHGCHH